MPNNQEKQSEISPGAAVLPASSPKPAKTADRKVPDFSSKTHGEEPPVTRVWFRAMRAMLSDDEPVMELEALPMAQFRLLWTVHFVKDSTMKDVSERLSVSQSTVTQLADRLVRRGLVERLADASDRRVIRLRVSALGESVLEIANSQRRQVFHAVWQSFTEDEQTDVLHGLSLLAERAEAVRAAQGHPLPPMLEPPDEASGENPFNATQEQPVVDLMARRVRGR